MRGVQYRHPYVGDSSFVRSRVISRFKTNTLCAPWRLSTGKDVFQRSPEGWFWTMNNPLKTPLGDRISHGGQAAPFSQAAGDRLYHTHIIGSTGTGKSTLLENLILADITAGHGVALIDPKGDLAPRILDHIPTRSAKKVIHFNPADEKWIVPLNILAIDAQAKKPLIRANTIEALASFWADSWGPRAEYILNRLILTLQECDRPQSLAGVTRLLVDPGYHQWVVKRAAKHPKVAQFWFDQYSTWTKGQRSEWTMPVINKLDLLSDEPLSHIIGQVKNTFSIRRAMDEGGILIIDLSKGRIGEKNANLLGSLWASALKSVAFTRVDQLATSRKKFFVYIDEFHNFTTQAFVKAFAELRGFKVGLTVAHQGLEQLAPELRAAVLENAGTLISFRVGGATAQTIASEFNDEVAPGQLTDLDNYQAYIKPIVEGKSPVPFKLNLYPAQFKPTDQMGIIVPRSARQFGVHRFELDKKFRRWQKQS